MCFADDLLVMCNGDVESLKVVKKSLDEFSKVSSLYPNLSKSTIFFGSIPDNYKAEMLQVILFKNGKLSMKYLGVPLLEKRLGVKDCDMLIENVENKINCWRNKLWFLWNAGDSTKGKAKVAWSLVCRPKEQGGLGLKPLKKWNETLWGWKCLLDIRDTIKPFVLYKIGNGLSISAWHDKWCTQGPLDSWIWPAEWENDFPELNHINVPILTQSNDAGNDLTCVLCNKCPDSHEHLFFKCSWTKEVWLKISGKGRFRGRECKLSNVVGQLEKGLVKNNIWQLIRDIAKNIEDSLMCLRVRRSNVVLKVANSWGLRCMDGKLMPAISNAGV
ncbi:hypothetical protein Tco_1272350 [Tanacetum coccineum]